MNTQKKKKNAKTKRKRKRRGSIPLELVKILLNLMK
jgi:hypothetical protein